MPTKFVRFVAALVVLVSIVGYTGVTRADHGAEPGVSSPNLEPPRAPEPEPLDIPPASSLGVQFVHVATAANIDAHTTLIDHPLTNGNPNAIVLVTPNYDPGGVCGCMPANFPIGVGYDSPTARWVIYSPNGAPDPMPLGAAFNVYVRGNSRLFLPLILRSPKS